MSRPKYRDQEQSSDEDSSDPESPDESQEDDDSVEEHSDNPPLTNKDKDDGDISSEDEAVKSFILKHKRVDDKEVTLKLKSGMINLYFDTLVGEGIWSKEARQDLSDKYHLSDKQFDRLSPPDLTQTRLHFLEGWDLTGLSNTLHLLHGSTRNVAKVLLKLYESEGSVELAMSNFTPVTLYEHDGQTRATEFSLPSLEAMKLDVEDKDVSKLLEENDPKIIARSYLAHKRVIDTARLIVDDAFTALEAAQNLANLAKQQHDKYAELTWDALQLLGQHDLHLKSTRESHFSKFLTKDFSQRLRAKNKDRSARKEKDKKDKFFSNKLDKVVSQETDTNKVHFS